MEEVTFSGPLGRGLGPRGQDCQCFSLSASLNRGTLAVGGRAVGRIWQGDGAPSPGRTDCGGLDSPVATVCRVVAPGWKPPSRS